MTFDSLLAIKKQSLNHNSDEFLNPTSNELLQKNLHLRNFEKLESGLFFTTTHVSLRKTWKYEKCQSYSSHNSCWKDLQKASCSPKSKNATSGKNIAPAATQKFWRKSGIEIKRQTKILLHPAFLYKFPFFPYNSNLNSSVITLIWIFCHFQM